MWVKYQGNHFETVKDFLRHIKMLPDAEVYRCGYDIAWGRDIIGENVEYPVGDGYRGAWIKRFAAAGISPRRGDEAFERALLIAKDIRFPPRSLLTRRQVQEASAEFCFG